MGGVGSAIALGIISNLATDLIRWAAGLRVQKVEEAILGTANAFPGVEGLDGTLRSWLANKQVIHTLDRFLQGYVGPKDLSIQDLVAVFLSETQFFIPEHAAAVSEKIIELFLLKVRAAYLAEPQFSGLILANRLDTHAAAHASQLKDLQRTIESIGGLKPNLERRFSTAVKELETGSVVTAQSLFESLLEELESGNFRLPELERSVHAKLGTALSRLGDQKNAADHLRRAAELDRDDPVRATINAASAEMLMGRPADAYARLDAIHCPPGVNLYNYWHSKAMALVELGRFEEALGIATRSDIGASEEAQHGLLGAIYLHAMRFVEAVKSYEAAAAINPKTPEWHFGAGEMLLMPLVEAQNQNPFAARTSEFTDNLTRAQQHLRDAAALFRSQGRSVAALHSDEKLALSYCLGERFWEAIQLLEPVIQDPECDRQTLLNIAFSYMRVNKFADAAASFKRTLALQYDPDIERMYIQALIAQGHTQEALEFLAGRTNLGINEDNLISLLNLVQVYCARREYSKAGGLIQSIVSKFPERADVFLCTAEFHDALSKVQDAYLAYENALRNAVGKLESFVRVQYGQFCLKQKEFVRAVDLWKPLMKDCGPRSLRDGYAIALFNSRNYTEVIRVVNLWKSADESISTVSAEVLSGAYEQLDELESARSWLEYVCARSGNRPEHISRLAQIDLRLGRREHALEMLDASEAALTTAGDILHFAKAYSLLNKPEKALDMAFKAAQLEKSPEVYSGYVGAFLAAGDDRVERSPEQIAFFQYILSNFQQLFPGAKQIQSFHIDPENPLEDMRKMLSQHEELTERALEAFRNRKLPLTTFAKAVGRDMYEVWRSLIGHPELPIFCAHGTEEEATGFQRLLTTASGVMLDLTALFTLARLDMLDKIRAIGDVYLAQHALDYLHYMQSARKIGGERGTVGTIKGQFFMKEISAEEINQAKQWLDKLTEWVERSGQARGFLAPLASDEVKWIEPLGEATLSTLAIAKQRSVLLLTDDKVLADLAQQTHGISSVNSQAALAYLLNKGLLSNEEYDKAVLRLVIDGYTYIGVTEEQFYRLLDHEDFQITPPVGKLFSVLESASTEIRSACAVVAGLLRRLFLETMPTDVREPVALFLLNTLVKSRSKRDVLPILTDCLRQQTILSATQVKRLEKVLSRW